MSTPPSGVLVTDTASGAAPRTGYRERGLAGLVGIPRAAAELTISLCIPAVAA